MPEKVLSLKVGGGRGSSSSQVLDKCTAWLNGLPERDRRELIQLEVAYMEEEITSEYVKIRDIARDWIEDHGGERRFWECYYLDDLE